MDVGSKEFRVRTFGDSIDVVLVECVLKENERIVATCFSSDEAKTIARCLNEAHGY